VVTIAVVVLHQQRVIHRPCWCDHANRGPAVTSRAHSTITRSTLAVELPLTMRATAGMELCQIPYRSRWKPPRRPSAEARYASDRLPDPQRDFLCLAGISLGVGLGCICASLIISTPNA